MSADSESILVCEGYQDRAFLSGWLQAIGRQSWKGKGYPPEGGRQLSSGHFGFGPIPLIRIVAAGSDTQVFRKAELFIKESSTRAIDSIVCVFDVDDRAAGARVAAFDAWAAARRAERAKDLQSLALPTLQLMLWHCEDVADDLPIAQTLERLVSAALREVYPERTTSVVDWLAGRPLPPVGEKLHKTHAAAHMAGWYAERGSENFFEAVWEDEKVRAALLDRLERSGAKAVLDAVLAATA